MKAEITNMRQVDRKLRKEGSRLLTDRKMWDNYAAKIKDHIIDRTEDGVNANSKSFKDYSEDYKKWRQENGLSTRVTLSVSGEMLRSIYHRKSRKGIRMAITSSYAKYHIEGKGVPQRDFLDITLRRAESLFRSGVGRHFSHLVGLGGSKIL